MLSGQFCASVVKIFTSKYVLLNLDSRSQLTLMSYLASSSVVIDLAKFPAGTD